MKRYNGSNDTWTIEILGDVNHSYIYYKGVPSKNLVPFTSNVAIDNDSEHRDPAKYTTLTFDHLIGREARSETDYVNQNYK